MAKVHWTEAHDDALAAWWAEGLSAAQIATRIPGATRNAVIGRVHRLALPKRQTATSVTRKPRPAPMLEAFADALAATAGTEHDGDVVYAGRQAGLGRVESHWAMQRLRRSMGAQAI